MYVGARRLHLKGPRYPKTGYVCMVSVFGIVVIQLDRYLISENLDPQGQLASTSVKDGRERL